MLGESKTITSYLLERKCIDTNTLQESITAAKKNDEGLLFYLAKNNLVLSDLLVKLAAEVFHLEVIDLSDFSCQKINNKLLSLDLMIRFHTIPLEKSQGTLKIALCDPSDLKALEIIKFQSGLNIACFLAPYDQIDRLIKKFKTQHYTDSLNTLDEHLDQPKKQPETTHHSDEPLIRFVNDMLENAIHKGAQTSTLNRMKIIIAFDFV